MPTPDANGEDTQYLAEIAQILPLFEHEGPINYPIYEQQATAQRRFIEILLEKDPN